ncbi:uncharacterized protein MONBRDRAFT_26933 [Monosiga brevicollis MX1]|uniref:Selenocysteine-specific elongation factor n=1 Tax=Monosiga brevicollis TaxID=81824 RepID=A9V3Y9_MONBE|nr:uncharacterized protein MONBRDRAFT_26933 [Monosiga brevicollis MX1]EDQ87889.1 predicted protein [Monosiga brevicollis MX1]|eukprot:XP_001747422.1 hypothetical protein [Monosiga brevicollis MX1]
MAAAAATETAGVDPGAILNLNVGVLGHVDSGKTSLAKALSTVASTAAFDKNPQSKARGITLDLGFSSFMLPLPAHLQVPGKELLQVTLVDCPGHASLIKTIIGGAQIIDLMMLVIDVQKGIQTQTAECLIIGEITCDRLVVVINKVDMLPEGDREKQIEKMKLRLAKTFAQTRFKNPPMITVAANPGSGSPQGIENLMDQLVQALPRPARQVDGPFQFAVDHCFPIKGQGTVLTGTITRGRVKVDDMIEVPHLQVQRKVKSMQMFKRPVTSAVQGDRLGICVTQFDASSMERGILAAPGSMRAVTAAVAAVRRIRFYKQALSSRTKIHVSVGHHTLLATVLFFKSTQPKYELDGPLPEGALDFDTEYAFCDELDTDETCQQYAVLEFATPVMCSPTSLVIGSRLDAQHDASACRLAFHGRLHAITSEADPRTSWLPSIRVYRDRVREGTVERVHDDYTLVCRDMFTKETDMNKFAYKPITLSTGDTGMIEGAFGQSGKFKVRLDEPLSQAARDRLPKSRKQGPVIPDEPVLVALHLRKYQFANK